MSRRRHVMFGILDDFGCVLRWVHQQPSSAYQYVTKVVREPRKKRAGIDWDNFEPALF